MPLKALLPDADVPVVQLSMLQSMDAAVRIDATVWQKLADLFANTASSACIAESANHLPAWRCMQTSQASAKRCVAQTASSDELPSMHPRRGVCTCNAMPLLTQPVYIMMWNIDELTGTPGDRESSDATPG